MKVKFEPDFETRRVIARLKDVRRMRQRLHLALLSGLKKIINISKSYYLSGPRPSRLAPRSGRMRGIISYSIGPWKGDEVSGQVGYGLGIFATRQIDYDWIHEYGYHGVEHVRPHTRMQTTVFGVPVTPFPVHVSGYSRVMNMPARPYLRTAIAQGLPFLVREIERTVEESV